MIVFCSGSPRWTWCAGSPIVPVRDGKPTQVHTHRRRMVGRIGEGARRPSAHFKAREHLHETNMYKPALAGLHPAPSCTGLLAGLHGTGRSTALHWSSWKVEQLGSHHAGLRPFLSDSWTSREGVVQVTVSEGSLPVLPRSSDSPPGRARRLRQEQGPQADRSQKILSMHSSELMTGCTQHSTVDLTYIHCTVQTQHPQTARALVPVPVCMCGELCGAHPHKVAWCTPQRRDRYDERRSAGRRWTVSCRWDHDRRLRQLLAKLLNG